jgi:hypothetical protein
VGKFSSSAWLKLFADGSAFDAFNDLLAHWHPRFAPVPSDAFADTAGGAIEGSSPGSGLRSESSEGGADPIAAFAVLAADHPNFGVSATSHFSEPALDRLTGATSYDRGIWHGSLSGSSFEADVAKAVGESLAAGHALFFTPDSGDYAGEAFLVLDTNGKAGFQAGEDEVFHLLSQSLSPIGAAPLDHLITPPNIGG